MIEVSLMEMAGIALIAANELGIAVSPYVFRLFPRLRKKKEARTFAEIKRVAAVICAHNEESTIGNILTVLQNQTRPAEAVYVVADNCSDRTAEIARSMGATVLVKAPTEGGGKADALKFFLEATRDENFDGFVFFDADTIPNTDFIEHILPGLMRAEMAVGYHSFENHSATWSEAANSMLGHIMWHHFFEPRYKAGVYSLVMGMGYGLRRSYLERLQWTPRTRTEDLALSLDAALTDAEFVLCPEAEFRDKQPETWLVSWHRMRRWMTGDLQCLAFYFVPLMKQICHGDFAKADFLFFLLSIPTFVLKALGMLCLIAATCLGDWKVLLFVLVFDFASAAYAILSKSRKRHLQSFSIPAFYFFYQQLPWIALSSFLSPTRHWVPGREAPCLQLKKNEELSRRKGGQ